MLAAHAGLALGSGPPPGWAWGPIWSLLYAPTGVAAWLVWRRIAVALERKRAALRLWGWQLLLSALWPAAFLGAHSPALALAVMACLLAAVLLTMRAFLRLQKQAGLLVLPYAVWLCCVAYFN
ncbi:MAG TPA: TspO/MBR family protein, partial [Acetobacteraceae bacterium]|nr:TspO/MBR family protein [Acetobacteraceae bacterium]